MLNQSFKYPYYPFEIPVISYDEKNPVPVIIAGGGPVGLVLALELARWQVPSVVIEAKTTVSDGSRAICMAERTMEILQLLNVASNFESTGLSWTHGTSYFRTEPVFRLEMPFVEDARFPPMTNLQQYYIEQHLVDAAAANPLIEIRWGSQVDTVQQLESGVLVTVKTPSDRYTIVGSYLAACDGARSRVREALGLRLDGTSYEGRYLIADIEIDSDLPTERYAFFDPHWNPGGTVLMHRQPDRLWRIDYQLQDDDDADVELDETRIKDRIQQQLDMIGETGAWRLEWYSLYKAHCLCLDKYHEGRVLFCGDAAHLVPIFGVRGLNSGMADANNLGWKLAGLLAGRFAAKILESYTLERRAATLDIFENAEKSTKFMTPPHRGYELLRNAVLSLSLKHDFAKGLINPRQSQPYDYVDSDLNGYQGDETDFKSGPRVGAPLISVKLSEDSDDYLINHMPNGFCLMVFMGPDPIPAWLLDDIADVSSVLNDILPFYLCPVGKSPNDPSSEQNNQIVTIPDPQGRLTQRYDGQVGSAYLLRPDQHVLARWRHLKPGDIQLSLNALFAPPV